MFEKKNKEIKHIFMKRNVTTQNRQTKKKKKKMKHQNQNQNEKKLHNQ